MISLFIYWFPKSFIINKVSYYLYIEPLFFAFNSWCNWKPNTIESLKLPKWLQFTLHLIFFYATFKLVQEAEIWGLFKFAWLLFLMKQKTGDHKTLSIIFIRHKDC